MSGEDDRDRESEREADEESVDEESADEESADEESADEESADEETPTGDDTSGAAPGRERDEEAEDEDADDESEEGSASGPDEAEAEEQEAEAEQESEREPDREREQESEREPEPEREPEQKREPEREREPEPERERQEREPERRREPESERERERRQQREREPERVSEREPEREAPGASATREEPSLPLAFGAFTGVIAFALGYLITYALSSGPLRNSAVIQVSGTDIWRAVGWVFYNAHYVDTVGNLQILGGELDVQTAVNLIDSTGEVPTLLYAVPVVLLLVAGAWTGYRGARKTDVAFAIRAGLTVVPAYFVLALIGAFLFRMSSGAMEVGPEPVTGAFLAGLVYPAVFGAIGSVLGSRL